MTGGTVLCHQLTAGRPRADTTTDGSMPPVSRPPPTTPSMSAADSPASRIAAVQASSTIVSSVVAPRSREYGDSPTPAKATASLAGLRVDIGRLLGRAERRPRRPLAGDPGQLDRQADTGVCGRAVDERPHDPKPALLDEFDRGQRPRRVVTHAGRRR